MKNPFYFLFLILIFLTACKQEPKNSIEKIPGSENEKSISNDDTIPKIENTKLEQKVVSKNQNKSLPFLPPPTLDTDENEPPVLIKNMDDYSPSGNLYNPEKIQQGDVVQEGPIERINVQNEPYSIADEPAEFPGGKIKFLEYIEKNKRQNKEMQIQGKCWLQFVVDIDGSISNVRIVRGIQDCPACEKEAKRLIENMPTWIPAKINGKQVKSISNVAVKFE
jgi:protein TonB